MLLLPVPLVPLVVEPVVEPVVVEPVVVEPVEPVPEYEPLELPEPIIAFVRIHSPPRAEVELDVALPVVPVVPVLEDDP